jgi:hypothetical protein
MEILGSMVAPFWAKWTSATFSPWRVVEGALIYVWKLTVRDSGSESRRRNPRFEKG